jgi:hypothetical protein
MSPGDMQRFRVIFCLYGTYVTRQQPKKAVLKGWHLLFVHAGKKKKKDPPEIPKRL